tara:strand:- start:6452 stop:7216 length:765 start_codon:yes stop_codon:yes gene_type:complete
MNKVLIIGNSHAACLRYAEKLVTPSYNVELDFLIAHGGSKGYMLLDDEGVYLKARPDWSTRKDAEKQYKHYDNLVTQFEAITSDCKVYFKNYSAVLLVGGEYMLNWPLFSIDVEKYSSGFLEKLFLELIESSTFYKWISSIDRPSVKSKIFVLSNPLINELAYETTPDNVAQVLPPRTNKAFNSTHEFSHLGIKSLGATYIPLPNELLSSAGNTTSAKFKFHTPKDMGHLNKLGGEIRLRNALDTLVEVGLLSS